MFLSLYDIHIYIGLPRLLAVCMTEWEILWKINNIIAVLQTAIEASSTASLPGTNLTNQLIYWINKSLCRLKHIVHKSIIQAVHICWRFWAELLASSVAESPKSSLWWFLLKPYGRRPTSNPWLVVGFPQKLSCFLQPQWWRTYYKRNILEYGLNWPLD